MSFITFVVQNTFSKFIYIAFLLFLLIISFAIVGMQLFVGDKEETFLEQRSNFNSFISAFLSVFQIITLDDWYKVFNLYYPKSTYGTIVSYFFSVIFIGNFIVLNLFIANMLDGFERAQVLLEEDEMFFLKDNKVLTLDENSPIAEKPRTQEPAR